jgi:hypothetical protein
MGGFTALDVLRRASGLLTSYRRSATGGSVRVVTMRTTGRARCIPNLYVDGGLWLDGWGQVESFFMKGDLAGIEVYPSRLTVPPQFDRGGECGSVVIWTRP